MKTRTILLVIAVFSIAPSFAQFHIGFKAGTNISKIDGKSYKEQFSYNYLIGGFAEIGLGNRFSLNPEVIFSQTTATLSNDYKPIYEDVINASQTKAKLNYLSIPILLNAKIVGPLHIEAGPQFSILTNSDKTFLQNGENAFKKGDFSLVGGAQLKFSIFRITGRYVIGLDNINKIDNKDEWTKQAIQLSVGIAL